MSLQQVAKLKKGWTKSFVGEPEAVVAVCWDSVRHAVMHFRKASAKYV